MAEAEPKTLAVTTTVIRKAEDDEPNKPNPFLSLVPNIVDFFKNNFNFPPPPPKQRRDAEPESDAAASAGDGKNPNSDIVKFSRQSLPPVKLEAEGVQPEQNTNPLVLWQVYAIGGFFVIRWALARWKDHMDKKKKPSNEEPPPADD